MSFRKKWNSPMNKAALIGVPVALAMSGTVCGVLYANNGGKWSWTLFGILFAIAWGMAINHGLRVKADETTIEGGRK